jgi:glycosyltransferase involved in cell wall biosynthesis
MKYVALVNKLMPLYRRPVFHELSRQTGIYRFTCFGDTKKQGGIECIQWDAAGDIENGGINWVKTSNYFYLPERLLWQTGIINKILFSKYKYFVFEGGVMHLPTWLFAVLCRIIGKKVIFWTHGFKGLDKGLKKIIRSVYFRLAHGILLYGDYSKKLMIESGFNPKRLFVVYNSLDAKEQFKLARGLTPSLTLQKKAHLFKNHFLFTVIFIGRLVKAKNINFLLNAVNDFAIERKPINCIIIGDGPEMESIHNFISANNLSNHIFLAGKTYAEATISEYFAMSDLLVSPGNVGLNCIHSLGYGVPVLTHDNLQFHGPEVEAIIPFKTGLLFKFNDYNDFRNKIKEWRCKNEKREVIKINCQRIIFSRYNPENHAKRIIDAIDKLK